MLDFDFEIEENRDPDDPFSCTYYFIIYKLREQVGDWYWEKLEDSEYINPNEYEYYDDACRAARERIRQLQGE